MKNFRTVDYITIAFCALAAAFCGIGSSLSAPLFCVSSTIGLIDAKRNGALPAAVINAIFLTLNLFNCIKMFF